MDNGHFYIPRVLTDSFLSTLVEWKNEQNKWVNVYFSSVSQINYDCFVLLQDKTRLKSLLVPFEIFAQTVQTVQKGQMVQMVQMVQTVQMAQTAQTTQFL